jgi:hypothetical protein
VESLGILLSKVVRAIATAGSADVTALGPEPNWHVVRFRLSSRRPGTAPVELWIEDDAVQIAAGQFSQFEVDAGGDDLMRTGQELEDILSAVLAGGLVEEVSLTVGGRRKSSRSRLEHNGRTWRAHSTDFWRVPLPTVRKTTLEYASY